MALKFLFVICSFPCIVYSQLQVNVDSLRQTLTNPKLADSSKVFSYIDLIKHYKKVDEDSSKLYFKKFKSFADQNNSDVAHYHYYRLKAAYLGLFLEPNQKASDFVNTNLLQALKHAKVLDDPKLICSINTRLAQENARMGMEELALKYAKDAEKISIENNLWMETAYIYGQLGKLYNFGFDKTEIALKYLLKSDSVYEANSYQGYKRGFTLSFIGDVYEAFDNIEKAVIFQKKALSIFEIAENEYQQNFIFGKLALLESKRKNFKTAITYTLNAIAYYKENKYPLQEATFNIVLCDIYYKSGQNKKSLQAGQNAIALSRAHHYDAGLMMALVKQATVMREANLFAKSNEFAQEAEILALKMEGYEELMEIYQLLYLNAESLGNYKQAYEYTNEYRKFKDSLDSKDDIKNAKELEAKYQSEKKEKEIQLLKAENDLVEQQKKNQRNILMAGLGITSLAGIFLFFLYKNRKRTNQKLQELDSFKNKLFANISHEFRTPLTLISGYTQKRLENESLEAIDKKELESIYRNSNRLEELVNQMLDLAKLESGHIILHIKQGDLSKLLKSIAGAFQLKASKKDISYHIAIADIKNAWYDADVIEKITTNLLSNAFKYCEENGTVFFKVENQEDTIKLLIENTNSKLSKHQLKHVYKRFYQANEDNDGVGIGLSLVKELVDFYNGTIEIHQKNASILFQVELPMDKTQFKESDLVETAYKPKALLDQDEIGDPVAIHDSIMLLVEDNQEIRAFISSIFENDYKIIEAENGELGLESARKHIPDVIISDIKMPEMDGYQLLNQLKADERTSHIPVILLTAKTEDQDKNMGFEYGADDYVAKPFKSKLLQTRVKNLIELRKNLQKRYSQEIVLRPKDIAISNLDELFLDKLQKTMDAYITDSSFTINEFSSALGMSRMQLHRKLKALTGLTATEFIRSQRLKLAKELLKNSNINISQIGYSVGFNDHSYFAKCFKEAYGCSPSKYIQKNQ